MDRPLSNTDMATVVVNNPSSSEPITVHLEDTFCTAAWLLSHLNRNSNICNVELVQHGKVLKCDDLIQGGSSVTLSSKSIGTGFQLTQGPSMETFNEYLRNNKIHPELPLNVRNALSKPPFVDNLDKFALKYNPEMSTIQVVQRAPRYVEITVNGTMILKEWTDYLRRIISTISKDVGDVVGPAIDRLEERIPEMTSEEVLPILHIMDHTHGPSPSLSDEVKHQIDAHINSLLTDMERSRIFHIEAQRRVEAEKQSDRISEIKAKLKNRRKTAKERRMAKIATKHPEKVAEKSDIPTKPVNRIVKIPDYSNRPFIRRGFFNR